MRLLPIVASEKLPEADRRHLIQVTLADATAVTFALYIYRLIFLFCQRSTIFLDEACLFYCRR